jgi:tRNA(fMet)-specific endonuclease VapC
MEPAAAENQSKRIALMSFLLDTDICSSYLKNDAVVVARVMMHFGGLNVSVITVGELLTWALRANAPSARLKSVQDLLKGATVLDVSLRIAEKFGEIRAGLMDHGIAVGEMDLLNGATALIHGLTMVTHNVQDYANIPGLTIDDWLIP